MAIILDNFDEFAKKYNLPIRSDENMHFSNKLIVNRKEDKFVLTYTTIKMLLESNAKLQETVAEQQKQIKALTEHGTMLEERLNQFWDMTHLRMDALFEKDNI